MLQATDGGAVPTVPTFKNRSGYSSGRVNRGCTHCFI
ncbi:hypothetical protein BMETH_2476_0 [methanotrophic bacterial endosymbiont of Bathymodiolus sp.]|nr:hypothetical protein BMETH_2476_0 [methanotrophic bacterial endosymbiont of Bathymodiolus sp.]